MDARKDRIGEHAADKQLPWAVSALGPVPDHPARPARVAAAGRLDRRLPGTIRLRPPRRPDRPRTRRATPDLRAAWHEALAALGPVDGPDVRGLPDGTLLHLRDTYPIETAWAPQWTGEELRQVRLGAAEARLAAIRATAEADTAHRHGQHETAAQQQALAASYQAMHDAYREREAVFAAVMADRQQWETRHPPAAAAGRRRRRRTAPPAPRPAVRRRCAPPNPNPSPRNSAPSSP